MRSRLIRRPALRRLAALTSQAAVFFTAASALAATRNVPGDYATIGAALTAAANGDTILLAPGTYSAAGDLNLDVNTQVTITSGGAASLVTIDLSGSAGSTFATFNVSATLSGVTVEHASGNSAVIFNSSDGSATYAVVDCQFTSNVNTGGPGAILLNGGNLSVAGDGFSDNTGEGAVQYTGSKGPGSGSFSGCTFDGNTGEGGAVNGGGGAINWNTGFLVVTSSSFLSNSSGASNSGGAVALFNGDYSFTWDTFYDNSASAGGGAVYVAYQGAETSLAIHASSFSDNSAATGGAMQFVGASADIADDLFESNTVSADGAVLDLEPGAGTSGAIPVAATVFNSSCYQNNATSGASAGTFSAGASSTLVLTNVIQFPDLSPHAVSTAHAPASVTITYSDIAGAAPAGAGNISADPQYSNPAQGYLSIPESSPCAHTGTSTGAPADDIGDAPWTGGVSMGAFAPMPDAGAGDAGMSDAAGEALDATADAGAGDATAANDSGTAADTGAAEDSGGGEDATATEDSGTTRDAAAPADATVPVDSGATPDAGAQKDAATPLDAGGPDDAGSPSDDASDATDDGGLVAVDPPNDCSCRVVGSGGQSPSPAFALALGAAVLARHRGRSRTVRRRK